MKLVAAAAVSLAAAVAGTVAQAATSPDLLAPLLNAGVVGVVLVLVLLGKLVPGRTHDQVVAERDRLAAELREHSRAERSEVIPLMTRNQEALARVAAILAELEPRAERGRP